MTDLKNVIADFQKTSAYAVLDDLVRVCGIDSVLGALSEITAAEQSVYPTLATSCENHPLKLACGYKYCPDCGKPLGG